MEAETLFYPERCIRCGRCDEGCYAHAREIVGRDMRVDEVLSEILEDALFYGKEGGATLSGGEPLLQRAFILSLIDASHERNIHVAVESNLCFPRDIARPVLEKVDLLMGDVKLWDADRHRALTGVGNEWALENFRMMAELGKPIILRTPVVPGINTEPAQIRRIARFAASLPTLLYYELLRCHPLGEEKAAALGFNPLHFETPSEALMKELQRSALEAGVRVLVDGQEGWGT